MRDVESRYQHLVVIDKDISMEIDKYGFHQSPMVGLINKKP